jgi:hypothetical protein
MTSTRTPSCPLSPLTCAHTATLMITQRDLRRRAAASAAQHVLVDGAPVMSVESQTGYDHQDDSPSSPRSLNRAGTGSWEPGASASRASRLHMSSNSTAMLCTRMNLSCADHPAKVARRADPCRCPAASHKDAASRGSTLRLIRSWYGGGFDRCQVSSSQQQHDSAATQVGAAPAASDAASEAAPLQAEQAPPAWPLREQEGGQTAILRGFGRSDGCCCCCCTRRLRVRGARVGGFPGERARALLLLLLLQKKKGTRWRRRAAQRARWWSACSC